MSLLPGLTGTCVNCSIKHIWHKSFLIHLRLSFTLCSLCSICMYFSPQHTNTTAIEAGELIFCSSGRTTMLHKQPFYSSCVISRLLLEVFENTGFIQGDKSTGSSILYIIKVRSSTANLGFEPCQDSFPRIPCHVLVFGNAHILQGSLGVLLYSG